MHRNGKNSTSPHIDECFDSLTSERAVFLSAQKERLFRRISKRIARRKSSKFSVITISSNIGEILLQYEGVSQKVPYTVYILFLSGWAGT